MKILYVEDNEDNIYILKRRLGRLGYDVSIATDGADGIAKANELKPDLILMDLSLPGMSGFEFLAELRERSESRHTPVVVITAKDLTEDDKRRLDGGVAHILQKSASSTAELLEELQRTLAECVLRRRRPAEAGREAA